MDRMGLESWRLLWAKSESNNPDAFHPLLCHLIDVAAVTRELWNRVLRPCCRERVAGAFGLDEASAGRWFAFWAGSHDMFGFWVTNLLGVAGLLILLRGQ